jgi:hypothetical protein
LKFIEAKNIKRAISPNTNNAIKHSEGEYIKIMYMDDFFVDNNALEKISNAKDNTNFAWCVNGCFHCDSINFLYNRHIPHYNHDIHLGKNTISCPTVLTLRQKEYFDESLDMLMDCEFYKRMYILCVKGLETFLVSIYETK